MAFCRYCGKEIDDNAEICLGCGCKVESNNSKNTPKPLTEAEKKKKKLLTIFVPILVAVVLLAGIALKLFIRPNVKLDDFRENNALGMIMQYGAPTGSNSDKWKYDECIKFYGIPVREFHWSKNDNEYTMFFDSAESDDVKEALEDHCDLKNNLSGIFYEYSYDDLEITFSSGGFTIVIIEVD